MVRYVLPLIIITILNLQALGQAQDAGKAQSSSDKKAEIKLNYEKLFKTDTDYAHAMEIYGQKKYLEALPGLETLAQRYPNDAISIERLGITLIATDATVKDADARKQQRARGRKMLVRAKELGIEDELNNYYISVIPEDGGPDTVFSNRKEANDAMQEGEAAFARGDYAAARESYIKAMTGDPNSYEAVLYIGDTYFAEKQYDPACEWFSRAVQVDPDRETAYRYWGDALMFQRKIDDARSKYIDAVIAQPYISKTRIGLKAWAEGFKTQLNIPDIKAPKRPEVTTKDSGDQQILLDAESLKNPDKKDGTDHWFTYNINSGAWQTKLFKEKFPTEKEYRHSLLEENTGLELVAKLVDEDIKKGTLDAKNLDPGIAALLKIYQANLLEPYILFILKDAGIAQDYAPYREKNRDKLRKFLDEVVVPKTPEKPNQQQ